MHLRISFIVPRDRACEAAHRNQWLAIQRMCRNDPKFPLKTAFRPAKKKIKSRTFTDGFFLKGNCFVRLNIWSVREGKVAKPWFLGKYKPLANPSEGTLF